MPCLTMWRVPLRVVPEPSMSGTVQDVVSQHLCTQCGTCVAVCPTDAIEMRETPAGLLYPSVNGDRCVRCGRCRQVCPGEGLNVELPRGIDPFHGVVTAAYVGYARDEVVRSKAQSGGVTTALLLYLLETGRIDGALVTTMPADGSLRPRPMLARTRAEILAAQGSKYCPAAVNAALGSVTIGDRIAVVGLPCHMHGIKLLMQCRNGFSTTIHYRIGLFCDRVLLNSCIDQLERSVAVRAGNLMGVDYRNKIRTGQVRLQLREGQDIIVPYSMVAHLKDCFTPLRCWLCFDKANILSDVSVGDPWGVARPVGGLSVVISRSQQGMLLLNRACSDGYLQLQEIGAEAVFRGQGIEERRRRYSAFMDVWRAMGRTAPEFGGMNPRFLARVGPVVRVSCKHKLMLNIRIADSPTKRAALAAARRYQRLARVQALVVRVVRKAHRIIGLFLGAATIAPAGRDSGF